MKNIMQHQRAKNDQNGNPRRLFVIYAPENFKIVKVINEGYSGRPEDFDGIEICPVDITLEEYRSTIRYAKNHGIFEDR